jgi:antirestriction protein
MTTTTEATPRVWIGCLGCYGAGMLVGAWYAAETADDVTPDDVHTDGGVGQRYYCEEIWCFDHEHLPISRECSPTEAAEWGRLIAGVTDWQRDALTAWVRSGDYIAQGDGDLPSLADFEERYAGEWDTFRDFAENLADDIGLLEGIADEIAAYFAYDYTTHPAPGGGVFVFRSL